jgi:predicted GNAT family N-acyltransferase
LAMHLMGWKEGKLAVYARILPPGVKYGEHSIGRVVVEPKARKGGLARAAMREAIARILATSPGTAIRIQAQNHLADTLYKPLGISHQSRSTERATQHAFLVGPSIVGYVVHEGKNIGPTACS